jgi:hypothetical protein
MMPRTAIAQIAKMICRELDSGVGPANYLSTRASHIAVGVGRSRGAVERPLAAVTPAMRPWPARSSPYRRR